MTEHAFAIRKALILESDAVGAIARRSRSHFLPYLPDLHSVEDDRRYFRTTVLSECDVWVAQADRVLVGFCAVKEGWVDHLYLLPGYTGKSIGKALLNKAKAGNDSLRLRVFQRNLRAIRFYEQNGFRKIDETDGASNEERTPDAIYQWCERRRKTGPGPMS